MSFRELSLWLSMYELIILSLLARRPMTGYLIAAIINDIIGPVAKASNGRIYPLLAKLREEGCLSEKANQLEATNRISKIYKISESGMRRFRYLMLEKANNPKDYKEIFAIKVTSFDLITQSERKLIMNTYEAFCKTHIKHLKRENKDLVRNQKQYEHSDANAVLLKCVLRHSEKIWQHELSWLQEIRKQKF